MIPIAKPVFGEEEKNNILKVLDSGMLAQGEWVKNFEDEFSKYIEVSNSIAVCNGTAALDLALKSIGIKEGDEVIVPDFTFIASANSVLFQNAKPVFADVYSDTFNINPEEINEKITPKTRAVMVVHLFGQSVDLKPILEICEDKNLVLIEDAAQAHGAEYNNKKVGSFGIGTFSFYPTKNMTSGEGGMITTNDEKTAKKLKLLRDHGQSEKYLHTELGYNLRLTNLGASIGLAQLKKLDSFNNKRIENAEYLTKEISKIKGLTPPKVLENTKHVFHQYVIKVENEFSLKRDELQVYLREKGVGSAVHYPIPIHLQPLYKNLGYPENICPITQELANKVLSLPVHPSLSKEDLDYIIKVLREA
ncbi:MAG: DegT/DnrJ/EryC1/StrS family aminotransferase [Candidatus ainarchaeum sp.]|nr:DegT/DnrJ/EryC1/StrS family aminotransferase [Candidatus ainarchaeum sp.]